MLKVKERYSWLSEQLMFEWSIEAQSARNKGKCSAYAFWLEIKDKPCAVLTLAQIMQVDKIAEIQKQELRRK